MYIVKKSIIVLQPWDGEEASQHEIAQFSIRFYNIYFNK